MLHTHGLIISYNILKQCCCLWKNVSHSQVWNFPLEASWRCLIIRELSTSDFRLSHYRCCIGTAQLLPCRFMCLIENIILLLNFTLGMWIVKKKILFQKQLKYTQEKHIHHTKFTVWEAQKWGVNLLSQLFQVYSLVGLSMSILLCNGHPGFCLLTELKIYTQ